MKPDPRPNSRQSASTARKAPRLAFEPHFQNDGLAPPPHARILVAVSGGSDSIALLRLLHDWRKRAPFPVELHAATVDHGLRADSADEARFVERVCGSLQVEHTTLTWRHDRPARNATSQCAREARYDLLARHATSLRIGCVATGHTMDDQAETVKMRALRGGGTRGLAGMALWTLHGVGERTLVIYRPLLGIRRERLRSYLVAADAHWIDDPSNENPVFERPRIRKMLATDDTVSAEQMARLASLAGRSRAWLSQQIAVLIDRTVEADAAGGIRLKPVEPTVPAFVAAHTLSVLVQLVGGKAYPPPHRKLLCAAQAWIEGRFHRENLGLAMVSVSKRGVHMERDSRRSRKSPDHREMPVQLEVPSAFVPATDLAIQRALQRAINATNSS